MCNYSEYWHSGAGGGPWGRRPNWSSRNVLHVPLCQLLLPQGVQPGLDERCVSFVLLSHVGSSDCSQTVNSFLCFSEKIFSDDIPKCDKCNSLVKPGELIFVSLSLFFLCPISFLLCMHYLNFHKCNISVSFMSLFVAFSFFLYLDIVFFGENLPVRFFTSMKMVSTERCFASVHPWCKCHAALLPQ